jgi:ATP-dependent DNA helicase RecG
VTVGTHALIQESVNFHKLGFVVIDEQHRFGVAQRQKLMTKSAKMPHLLAMTATPIPRSLQLTVYGELEVSLLQEKPSGRKPILTKIVSPVSRTTLLGSVDREIEHGRQVYVVCPLIEELEGRGKKEEGRGDNAFNSELASVTAEYERLKKTVLKHRRIGLLHGKMPADDKDRVMKQFASHELDVLVSTTVIEVGVDVPNATVMIIEGAERFGLAQLHQLRGRVGRSEHQSYCYLVTTESKQTTSLRLRELEHSNDGFYLAEKDLEMRGPGEIYGRVQHGQLDLQVASLADTRSIVAVKDAIAWAKENGIDLLQYEGMRGRVERYRRLTTLN